MDDLCLSQNFLQKELYSELKRLWDLPETNSDGYESPLPGEDSLFSQYLRSLSPSCFSAQGIGGNHDSDGRIHSQTATLSEICLCAEENPYPANSIDQNTAKPENILVKTNRPRVTLRIRLPKPGPRPKLLLRLSQPKPAQPQGLSVKGLNSVGDNGLKMTLYMMNFNPRLPDG